MGPDLRKLELGSKMTHGGKKKKNDTQAQYVLFPSYITHQSSVRTISTRMPPVKLSLWCSSSSPGTRQGSAAGGGEKSDKSEGPRAKSSQACFLSCFSGCFIAPKHFILSRQVKMLYFSNPDVWLCPGSGPGDAFVRHLCDLHNSTLNYGNLPFMCI